MAQGYHPQMAFAMSNPSSWNNLRQDMSGSFLNPPLYPQYPEHLPVPLLSSQDRNLRAGAVSTQHLHGGGPNDVKFDDPGVPSRPEMHPPVAYPPASNPDGWRLREMLNDVLRLRNDFEGLNRELRDELSRLRQLRGELTQLRELRKVLQQNGVRQ